MVLIDLQRGGRGPCSRLETPINFYVFRFVKKVSGRAFLFFFLHTPGSVREGMARNPIQVGMAQGGGANSLPEFAAFLVTGVRRPGRPGRDSAAWCPYCQKVRTIERLSPFVCG